MADESLDEILSSATPAAMPEPTQAETTTEQQPAPADDGTARDEHGRFAPKAPAQPEATAQQPNAAEPENGTVPQQALHEARQQAKSERERADRLERVLLERSQPPKPAPEPEKPVELWDDPDKWADSRLSARLTPIEQALQSQKLGFSRMMANDKFGDDTVKAADAALGELARTNRAEAERIAQRMHQSVHPYGELVSWHKEQAAQQRIGSDPDAFVQSELEKMLADPAKRAQLAARLGAPAPVSGQTPASVTRIPQSLSRIPGGIADPVVGDESIEDILKSGRRRG